MLEVQPLPVRPSITRIAALVLAALVLLTVLVVALAIIGVAGIVDSSQYMTSVDVEGGRFPYTIDSISARVGTR